LESDGSFIEASVSGKNIHSPICDGHRLIGMSDWPARNMCTNGWMGCSEKVRAWHGPRAQIQHTLIWARLTCQAKMYSPLFCFVLFCFGCVKKKAISLLSLKKNIFVSLLSPCAVHTAKQSTTEQNRVSPSSDFFSFKKRYSNSSVAWCMETWRACHCSCQISGTKTAHVLHRMNANAHAWVIGFYALMCT
jgi:hypothetical protein